MLPGRASKNKYLQKSTFGVDMKARKSKINKHNRNGNSAIIGTDNLKSNTVLLAEFFLLDLNFLVFSLYLTNERCILIKIILHTTTETQSIKHVIHNNKYTVLRISHIPMEHSESNV